MNAQCRNRIENWKFTSAMATYEAVVSDEDEHQILLALSETFGNCGWFDGAMGTIVGAAVAWLLREKP